MRKNQGGGRVPHAGAYIEVVTKAHAASPLAIKLHEAVTTLYKS